MVTDTTVINVEVMITNTNVINAGGERNSHLQSTPVSYPSCVNVSM